MFNTLLTILKFLPEVISLIKWLETQISNGVERHELRKRIEHIDRAFSNDDRVTAARDLNDIFRNR